MTDTQAVRMVPVRATPQQLETAAFNLSAEIGHEAAMALGMHIELAYELLVAAAPSVQPDRGDPTCQVCGTKIEAWTCQGCGAAFHENAAGALVLGIGSRPPPALQPVAQKEEG